MLVRRGIKLPLAAIKSKNIRNTSEKIERNIDTNFVPTCCASKIAESFRSIEQLDRDREPELNNRRHIVKSNGIL